MRIWSPVSHLRFLVRPAIVVILLAAAGCERASHTKPQVEISVWSMWTGQEEQNFNRILRRYESLHPGIRMRNLGAVTDDSKTIRALVAGVPPDLFTLADNSFLGPMARNGALRPLDSQFARSHVDRSGFVPISLSMCRYGSRLYGIPFLIDDGALMWNKSLFSASGIDPDRPPRSLEELADYAVRLTQYDKDGAIVRLGLRPLGDPYLVMKLFGGRLVDPATGKISADDPGNVAALAWYKHLIDRLGGISKVRAFVAGFGRDQGTSNPFYLGKVAMQIGGEWDPYWASRYAPQLSYGVSPAPIAIAHPELAHSTWLGGNIFCIPVESRRPREAWDFLVWTQTPEAQILFARAMNNVPNQRSVLTAPALVSGPPFRSKYAEFLKLADGPNAGFFPALPVANLYMSSMANAMDKVLYGDLTPAAALADVRVRVQRELDRS